MDPETVDQNYAQLQQRGQQTAALIQALERKLQAAVEAGDSNASGWLVDLEDIALGVQQEEGKMTLLLQSIHSMVGNHVQAVAPVDPQHPGYQPGAGRGAELERFLGGTFGRAIMNGVGFGIGGDLVNKIL